MAKRSSKAKQSDFLRFRPYHAFTTPAEQTRQADRARLSRLMWALILGGVVVIAAVIFFSRLH